MAIEHLSPFTGTNGDDVSTLSPTTGVALVSMAATVRVTSNKARRNSGSSPCSVRTNDTYSSADYTVSAIFTRQGSTNANDIFRLAARLVDTNNCYRVRYFSGTLRLDSVVGGTATQIGSSYSWTPTVGVPAKIALKCSSTTVSVEVNDVQQISGTSSSYASAGYAALYLEAGAAENVDTEGFNADDLTVDVVGGSSTFFRPYFITG